MQDKSQQKKNIETIFPFNIVVSFFSEDNATLFSARYQRYRHKLLFLFAMAMKDNTAEKVRKRIQRRKKVVFLEKSKYKVTRVVQD